MSNDDVNLPPATWHMRFTDERTIASVIINVPSADATPIWSARDVRAAILADRKARASAPRTTGRRGGIVSRADWSGREELAAMAMQGLLANPGGPIGFRPDTGWGWINGDADGLADTAFYIADAMLARAAQSEERGL